MKREKLKYRVSFKTTVEDDGHAPHLYRPMHGVIYLTPDFNAGDCVRVTVTKIKAAPRKGKRK